jgi:hypothetical protein
MIEAALTKIIEARKTDASWCGNIQHVLFMHLRKSV